MNRREFGWGLAAAGFAAGTSNAATTQIDRLHLSRNGWVPNNEQLPVLHYHRAFDPEGEAVADRMTQIFKQNTWPAQWRNGVYDYHHYHSTAHEVLGIAGGEATLMLGGENGHEVVVRAGDVLVLPTGTGHCRIRAGGGFLVVGAYPVGQTWDICRAAPGAGDVERMRSLPFPTVDPVQGSSGELVHAWHSAI